MTQSVLINPSRNRIVSILGTDQFPKFVQGPWRGRIFKVAGLAVGAVLLGSFALETACAQAPHVDALKDFLSSPATVRGLIFKKRELFQPTYDRAPTVDTNSYQYFFGRWQKNDFLLRQAANLEEIHGDHALTNAFFAFGKSGSLFWKIVGDNYVYWQDKDMAYTSEFLDLDKLPRDQDVLREVSMMGIILHDVVSIGIAQLKPGSLKWIGNSFQAEDTWGKALKGELADDGKLPSRIRYKLDGELGESVVEFHYESSDPSHWFPDQFTRVFIKTNGSRIPISEITIISLELASSQIPAEDFSGKALQVPGFTKTILHDGTRAYYIDPNGRTIPMNSPTRNGPFGLRRVLLVAAVIISILSLFFLLRAFRKENTNLTNPHEPYETKKNE